MPRQLLGMLNHLTRAPFSERSEDAGNKPYTATSSTCGLGRTGSWCPWSPSCCHAPLRAGRGSMRGQGRAATCRCTGHRTRSSHEALVMLRCDDSFVFRPALPHLRFSSHRGAQNSATRPTYSTSFTLSRQKIFITRYRVRLFLVALVFGLVDFS